MVRVKICGITQVADAKMALDAGADAIGLVFAKSPRRVTRRAAQRIARAVGPWVSCVGVFVNEPLETARRIASSCGLDVIQLHGDEPAGYARELSEYKIIKSFRVAARADVRRAFSFPADALLFDSRVEGLFGGSGKSFDWKLLEGAALGRPVIVSGGLEPANVAEAVRRLRPYGVDVSSGVEKTPGRKDPRKVREFIHRAKNA